MEALEMLDDPMEYELNNMKQEISAKKNKLKTTRIRLSSTSID